MLPIVGPEALTVLHTPLRRALERQEPGAFARIVEAYLHRHAERPLSDWITRHDETLRLVPDDVFFRHLSERRFPAGRREMPPITSPTVTAERKQLLSGVSAVQARTSASGAGLISSETTQVSRRKFTT